jgi:hypothetical protein
LPISDGIRQCENQVIERRTKLKRGLAKKYVEKGRQLLYRPESARVPPPLLVELHFDGVELRFQDAIGDGLSLLQMILCAPNLDSDVARYTGHRINAAVS